MVVPKTAVDEDDDTVPSKYEVRRSRKGAIAKAKAEA